MTRSAIILDLDRYRAVRRLRPANDTSPSGAPRPRTLFSCYAASPAWTRPPAGEAKGLRP